MNKESGEKAQKTQKGGNRGERRLGGLVGHEDTKTQREPQIPQINTD